MNRKSTFKLLGIIALVTLIGFSMTACASLDLLNTSSPSTPRGPQTTVRVTDIPSEYIGMLAWIQVDIPNSQDAWNMATISGDSVTFPLLDFRNDRPYSVSGDYMVFIFIFSDLNNFNNSVYDGFIMSKRIQENTTIAWSEFIAVP